MIRALFLIAGLVMAWAPADARQPRSRAVLREFQRLYPCPSTGLKTGACPGWQRDHEWPLECGGSDTVANLQWLQIAVHWAKTRVDNARCRTVLA